MMDTKTILAILLLLLPIFLLASWLRARSVRGRSKGRTKKYGVTAEPPKEKHTPITSAEDEVSSLRSTAAKLQIQIEEARSSYSEQYATLKSLEQQVAIYDEKLSFAELGSYEPHFEFNDTEEYKQLIKSIRDRQKGMVSAGTAIHYLTDEHVGGSRANDRVIIERQIKLTLRAFNNECEAAIANTRWNNANAMEKRIVNAADQINKTNEHMNLHLSEEYVSLKLDELHATHDYRDRLKVEKEKRVEVVRAAREEKKLLAEAAAAEREEQRYRKLLDKARSEAVVDEERVAELEAALAEAEATSERARAMVEVTNAGYVYIVSNIGSFGEDVVKIGLTRRFDPEDCVKELGDASVPFGFDTHAVIYSDDAPALRSALHEEFAQRRVNALNMRKDFFRVTLVEVEEAVKRLVPSASFSSGREAQEWHETTSLREEGLRDTMHGSEKFPESI